MKKIPVLLAGVAGMAMLSALPIPASAQYAGNPPQYSSPAERAETQRLNRQALYGTSEPSAVLNGEATDQQAPQPAPFDAQPRPQSGDYGNAEPQSQNGYYGQAAPQPENGYYAPPPQTPGGYYAQPAPPSPNGYDARTAPQPQNGYYGGDPDNDSGSSDQPDRQATPNWEQQQPSSPAYPTPQPDPRSGYQGYYNDVR